MKKILKRIVIVVMTLVLALTIAGYAVFHNELTSLSSLKKVDNHPLYTMEYTADYGLDRFMETGASSDEELTQFVIKQVLKGLPLTIKIPNLGCSTFLAENTEGGYLFGRNFDMDYSPAILVRTAPKNGNASLSMVNLAFLGYGEDNLPDSFKSSLLSLAVPYAPLDGINEMGLAVGVLLIPTEATDQKTDKVDITTTTAIRMMLDTCSNVNEAVKMLSQYDMHSSANSCYHFQIAYAAGNSVVVEYIDNEMKIVEKEGNYQCATNFLLTPGKYDFGKGYDRYEILDTTLKEKEGKLTSNAAMNLLSSVAQAPHKTDDDKISETQWSCVYDLNEKSVTISMKQDYSKSYTYYVNE